MEESYVEFDNDNIYIVKVLDGKTTRTPVEQFEFEESSDDAQTDILYKVIFKKDIDLDWMRQYTNDEVMLINDVSSLGEIWEFYQKYDYNTLELKEGQIDEENNID